MIIAYHVIFGAYGFWLPNDPRGSWSDFVGAWELLRFGRATTVRTRRSLAAEIHDAHARALAKQHLKYPPVHLTGVQARAVGRGFGQFAGAAGLKPLACSILPEHVHLVIARHRYSVEQMVRGLKAAATRRLNAEGIHPLRDCATGTGRSPKAFARGQWKVFLDSADDVRGAVGYVEDNARREGKPFERFE